MNNVVAEVSCENQGFYSFYAAGVHIAGNLPMPWPVLRLRAPSAGVYANLLGAQAIPLNWVPLSATP
jgi:hypothetical protein